MDYIFEDWEKKMSAYADSVEKDLEEVRKCKNDILKISEEIGDKLQRGHYIHDDDRIIISAPEVIIGHVDQNGILLGGKSAIIVRGTQVGLQASGEGGTVETQATNIRQIAEDPGVDGREHVVNTASSMVSQARTIVIQGEDAKGMFAAPTSPNSNCGVFIRSDQHIDISAAREAETREAYLDNMIKALESQKDSLKEQAADHKDAFKQMQEEVEGLLKEKEKTLTDEDSILENFDDINSLNTFIDEASMALAEETSSYAAVLSLLAETNRQLKCLKKEKEEIKKGDEYKNNTTGAAVAITGEAISLVSADGEGNLRDNLESGITMKANTIGIASVEADGQLKKEGKVSITAKNIDVATAGEAGQEYEDGELKTATYEAEGDFTLRSKNITIEAADYEVAEKKRKEKQLTADSKIKLRAKTIEVSTEGSKDIEVDDEGKLTKATYTSEGDLIVRSKTVTVESNDRNVENGEAKETALTADSKFSVRAEKMELAATDTEGKATGSVNINAKAVSVKSMDVEKEKRTDDKLAEGSTMTLVSEKLYIGSKSKDIKSKLLQAQSEEIGLFADKTFEAQQGEAKAVVQLADGKTALGGDKTDIYGDTTINAKAEVKGEIKTPKATIDNIEAKTSFKSPNISDGMAVGAGGGGGSVSAKMKAEDAPKE